MKNKLKLLVLLFCLSSGSILAQNIQVLMSPKPSPYISDWKDGSENVKLVISYQGKKEITVKIKTELYDGKGALVANTDASKMPELIVAPNSTTTYDPEDIFPSSAINYKGNLEKTAITTGRIPDDNYKLCVTLTDAQTGKPVGTSSTVCKVFTITAYQAPVLLAPSNKAEISETEVKRLVFKWSPLTPSANTIVTYRLQVWEVISGQDNLTALRSNQPIVEKDLKGILQTDWPVEFASPEAGKKYLWTVTPLGENERKLVDGNGFAEPFSFSVGYRTIGAPAVTGTISCHGNLGGVQAYALSPVLNNNSLFTVSSWNVTSSNSSLQPSATIQGSPAGILPMTTNVTGNAIMFTNPTSNPVTFTFTMLYTNGTQSTSTIQVTYSNCDSCRCAAPLTSVNYDYHPDGSMDPNSSLTQHKTAACGSLIHIVKGSGINFTSWFTCLGNCTSSNSINSDKYDVYNLTQSTSMLNLSAGSISEMHPMKCDSFKVVIRHKCYAPNGTFVECPPCTIYIKVDCPPEDCTCKEWNKLTYRKNGGAEIVTACNSTIVTGQTDELIFTNHYYCNPKGCAPNSTSATIYNPSGVVYSTTTDLTIGFNTNHITMPCGIYTVVFKAKCGSNQCDSCVLKIRVCDTCKCEAWYKLSFIRNNSGISVTAACNNTIQAVKTDELAFTNIYHCFPKGCPTSETSTTIYNPDGSVYATSSNLLITFNSAHMAGCGLYKVVFKAKCTNTECPPCTIYINIKCDSCCPGKWGEKYFTTADTSNTVLTCDKHYKIKCNKFYFLNASYSCNDKPECKGKVTYKVSPSGGATIILGVFTATLSGTYAVTMYGWCGDKICDSCIVFFDVKCKSCCPGKWGKTYYGTKPGGMTSPLLCNKGYKVNCNQPYYFTSSFYCNDNPKCKGKTTFRVYGSGATIIGNVFTATAPGLYKITMYGWCGKEICDSCLFEFKVDDCKTCCPGKWGKSGYGTTPGAMTTPLYCDKGYKVKCEQAYYLTSNYYCNDNPKCKGKVTYTVSPAEATITGNVFFATTSGLYKIKRYGWCGENLCDSCIFEFKVDDCKPCDIVITGGPQTGDTLCKGAPVTITWTGTLTGNVDICFVDIKNWVVYQWIATNVPNTGTYTWTIPNTIPCDSITKWQFYIQNVQQTCWTYGPAFYIKCCDECCPGKWGDKYYTTETETSKTKVVCGEGYKAICNQPYNINASYMCKNNDLCEGNVSYKVSPSGATVTPGGVFVATASGTYNVTIYGWCGGKICDSCVFKYYVICKPCCPGKWGLNYYTTSTETGKTELICKKTYNVNCKQAYNLTSTYICNDGAVCKGFVTYKVSPAGATIVSNVFTATSSGTYTITMYGWCNDKICDSCVFYFKVDCKPCCPGKWGNMYYYTPFDETKKPLACKKEFEVKCKVPYILVTPYLCNNAEECKSQLTYKVSPSGATMTGSVFTATVSGNYAVTVYGWCNDKICDSCVIYFIVKCKPCCPGKWGDKYYFTKLDETKKPFDCKNQYEVKCKVPYYLVAYYLCNDETECKGKVTYKVSPTGATITGSTFVATASGTYTITMYGWCNDKICDSCVFYFKANCNPCCPGKWGENFYYTESDDTKKPMLCKKKYLVPCEEPVYLLSSYFCNDGSECKGKVTYNVTPIGATITPGGVFTASVSGIYTVTMYGWCNSEICDSCKITFVAKCCDCAGGWSKIEYLKNGSPNAAKCGETIQANEMDVFTNIQSSHLCTNYCDPKDITTIYYPDNTVYSITSGHTVVFNSPNAFHPCGLYKVVFRGKCGNNVCDSCILYINVACCVPGKMEIYDTLGNLTNPDSCIKSGKYYFKLNPALPTGTLVNYTYVIQPDNIVVNNTFTYTSSGLLLNIPLYSCGTASIKLRFSWYNGMCKDSIFRMICQPPCCDFVSDSIKDLKYSGSSLNFTNIFAVDPPPATISKIKVQILEISYNGNALPTANILKLQKMLPAPTVWGDVNTAITNDGNAIWFNSTTHLVSTAPFSGVLKFSGTIINAGGGSTSLLKLKLRYTFYKDNGSGCPAVICEKDIIFKP